MLSFTILTTEAYEGIRDWRTRTPMILDEQGRKSWLEGETRRACGRHRHRDWLPSSVDARE